MSNLNFTKRLEATNKKLKSLRANLLEIISDIMKQKKEIELEDDQPLIHTEDGAIAIEAITKKTASGINQNGVRSEHDLADLPTDDLQLITEAISSRSRK